MRIRDILQEKGTEVVTIDAVCIGFQVLFANEVSTWNQVLGQVSNQLQVDIANDQDQSIASGQRQRFLQIAFDPVDVQT